MKYPEIQPGMIFVFKDPSKYPPDHRFVKLVSRVYGPPSEYVIQVTPCDAYGRVQNNFQLFIHDLEIFAQDTVHYISPFSIYDSLCESLQLESHNYEHEKNTKS